jgi:hypothetical protein
LKRQISKRMNLEEHLLNKAALRTVVVEKRGGKFDDILMRAASTRVTRP